MRPKARNAEGIGARLAEARRTLGLTQEELADRLGMGYRTLTASEAETRALTAGEIAGLCELGVDANWLVTGKGAMMGGQVPAADAERPAQVAVTLAADAEIWRRMLVTTVGVFQRQHVDLHRIDPEQLAKVVDIMVDIEANQPGDAPTEATFESRPSLWRRLIALASP